MADLHSIEERVRAQARSDCAKHLEEAFEKFTRLITCHGDPPTSVPRTATDSFLSSYPTNLAVSELIHLIHSAVHPLHVAAAEQVAVNDFVEIINSLSSKPYHRASSNERQESP